MISTMEQFYQLIVYIRSVQEVLQLPADFDPASLCDPEEDHAIYGFLDRHVQLPCGKGFVPDGYILGKTAAPLFQFGQEDADDLGCATLYPAGWGMLLQG